jgi:hypothetical protein
VDNEICEFSNKLRKAMKWENEGRGLRAKLDKHEIQVLFGHLNTEHDYLVQKLNDLIKSMVVNDGKVTNKRK